MTNRILRLIAVLFALALSPLPALAQAPDFATLVAALGQGGFPDREAAMNALVATGDERVPPILQAMSDGALYVRSANGPDSGWYRGTQLRGLGHISAGGVEKDVTFTRDDSVNTELDAAYQAKYNHAPSAVASVTSATAASTTLRVDPQ